MDTPQRSQPTLETRLIGGLVIVVLVLAFLSLYFYPDFTNLYFAWTIKPDTTAILIGEGYLAGALFFVHVISGKKWQFVQAGFLPITAFTILMMSSTLLHWDRFHQGTFIFYLWTAIYALTPFLVPFMWWRNRSRKPRTPETYDLQFSTGLRRVLGTIGVLGLGLGLTAFFWPAFYIAITPWKLTELTARIFSGWTVLTFATCLSVAIDGRWSATRLLLQSVILGQALTILALPRIWADLDPAKPMTYLFVGGLILSLVTLIAIYAWTEFRVRGNGIKTALW